MQAQEYIVVRFTIAEEGEIKEVTVSFDHDGSDIFTQAREALVMQLGHEKFRIMSWRLLEGR